MLTAKVKEGLELLGTGLKFQKDEKVFVEHAYNQPDNENKCFIEKINDPSLSMLAYYDDIYVK